MKTTLGQRETQLLAYCHMRGTGTVRTGDLTGPLQITEKQERELLSRMARAGIIARVKRGLYLIPPRLPLGGIWSPGQALAINTLMDDHLATYQICGPSAFNYYGLDDQIPIRVYAYNDCLSGERKIGAVELSLIKVAAKRLGSTEAVQTASGGKLTYSSRARTLVDAVYDWSRFDSLPRGYSWIRTELGAGRVEATELVKTAVAYGNQGTIRRIGALMEQECAEEEPLRTLESALNPSKSVIAAVPRAPRRGSYSKRWGVILNERQ
jgi:predicted transcriptional regulator of viral defense system